MERFFSEKGYDSVEEFWTELELCPPTVSGRQNSDSVVFIWTQRVLDRVGTLSARLLLIKESVSKADETGLLGIAVYD